VQLKTAIKRLGLSGNEMIPGYTQVEIAAITFFLAKQVVST